MIDRRAFERDLVLSERAVWGICPSCKAIDGEPCRPPRHGDAQGVHIGRLRAAPIRVRVQPIFSALPKVTSTPGDLWCTLNQLTVS